MDDAAIYAGRMIVLSHGKIVMDGTPREVFSRGEELKEIGLSVPTMTRLAEELRKKGVPIEDTIYTISQMKNALLKLKGGAVDA
jgi:ABC-type multidrug transport system ATPase subunit